MLNPMKSLRDKLVEKQVLEEELAKVEDKVEELEGDKKVKIKRKSLKSK